MRRWWQRRSYEIPLAIGDALWEVLVVQFAAFLDRLTLRRIIALVPLVVLMLAYAHSIPIPPELMLVGDFLAYIDIFSVLLLLGLLSRVATIVFITRQAAARLLALAAHILPRLDVRHRREGGARTRPRRRTDRSEDDRAVVAWAQVAIA